MSRNKDNNPEIIIDEEFMRLLPPLDKHEFCSLEDDILIYGCMNPLVLWNGILIDGHNRYNIIQKHDLPFNTVSLEFDSRDEVMAWMIKHQIDRRNLTPMQLTYFRGLHYNLEKKIHGGAERFPQNHPRGQNVPLEGSTANRLSEQYRVTPRTIKRDGQIADVIIAIGKESIDAKTDILSGKTPISRKQLREMISGSKDDIAKTASEIATGTFESGNKSSESDSQKGQESGNSSSDKGSSNNENNNILTSGEHPIKPGKYLHFKGNHYDVVGFAKNSETLDDMVIYRALYGESKIWVRPLSMWQDTVKDENGKKVKRFKYIG